DIKTTMGLDFIRAKSAAMARKIYAFGLIAHNLIRWQMLRASYGRSTRHISFAGTLQALCITSRQMHANTKKLNTSMQEIVAELVAHEILPNRPGRHQPRVKKRRPKKFQLMTKPRQHMVVSP